MSQAQTDVDQSKSDSIVSEWSKEPSAISEDVVDRYGLPDEATESQLRWFDTGPWKRTELSREGVPHTFPVEDTDYLEQVIDYQVHHGAR